MYEISQDRTDEQLVEETLGGVQAAFEELVRRHQDSVFNLALQMSRNWHVARDLTQESFVRAFCRLTLYRAGYSFRNWVMALCANLARNHFRAESRRRAREQEHVTMEMMLDKESGEGQAVAENLQALDQAVGQLADGFRIPLVLKHVEGLDYESIAAILNIGVSAAKMRVKRGREELVRVFAERGRKAS